MTTKQQSNLKYRRSKKGIIGIIYNTQKSNSRKRNHKEPSYTLDELRLAILDMPLFHTLYDNWVASNYNIDLTPSLDRIDDYEPYTETNIELVTWKENKDKGHTDRKEGRNNKQSRAVDQFTLDEEYITTYHSIHEAERTTGVARSGINKCCSFKLRSSGNFLWQYAS